MRGIDNPARQVATVILLVLMIASGIAASLSLIGRTEIALQVCVGGVGVSVLVLLVGGFVVASTNREDTE